MSFYSKLVRLKDIVDKPTLKVNGFLFQTGSIKSPLIHNRVKVSFQFLFQTGSIKRGFDRITDIFDYETFLFQTGSIKRGRHGKLWGHINNVSIPNWFD